MRIGFLFLCELKFRWRGSLLASVAVAVAVFAATTGLYLLDDFDAKTEKEVLELQRRSEKRMDALENEARIFAKSLGFNILIYNEAQRLETFHADDRNTHYLSMVQANALADANMELLNHHLPFLRHRYRMDAFGGDVIIAGLEGEIYIKSKRQLPIEVRIEPGQVQLGSSVALRMEKAVGDSIRIGDSDYEVTLCRSQLGTKDDIVIFMNLSDAQDLLGLKGKISGILALSCNCAAGDLEPIRNGVRKIVPEAQVVEFTVRAQARARARRVIADAAAAEKADIENSRKNFRKQLEQFSLLFSAITVAAASILLFFLYSHNVKERRHEIAILRTLGVNTIRIYYIFFVKALLLAVIGVLVGYIGSVSSMGRLGAESSFTQLWDWWLALMLLLSACFVSITASIIPVIIAAQQEPGTVLNEEA